MLLKVPIAAYPILIACEGINPEVFNGNRDPLASVATGEKADVWMNFLGLDSFADMTLKAASDLILLRIKELATPSFIDLGSLRILRRTAELPTQVS